MEEEYTESQGPRQIIVLEEEEEEEEEKQMKFQDINHELHV
jgi:hypothetical protein